ncbi:MAG: hypothetical protein ABIH23_00500 [bacterium]
MRRSIDRWWWRWRRSSDRRRRFWHGDRWWLCDSLASLSHHLGPPVGFFTHKGNELLRRRTYRFGADLGKLLSGDRRIDDLHDLGIQPCHDLAWYTGWEKQTESERHVETWQTCLGERLQLGNEFGALVSCDRQDPRLASARELLRHRQLREGHLHLTALHRGGYRSLTRVRHVLDGRPGQRLELLTGKLTLAAESRRAVCELVWLGLGIIDQLPH